MEKGVFLSAVEQYQNTVYRIGLHWFGNQQDAEDIVQETRYLSWAVHGMHLGIILKGYR